jgi:hypothetical protein
MQRTMATSQSLTASAWVAVASAILVLIALFALHVLSPQFDPSWRVVSEYANGGFGWLLSLMFAFWALSSWTLAFALRGFVRGTVGKIGLGLLVVAGIGETLAAIFDINQPLHGVADVLGAGLFPVAAILISAAISRDGAVPTGRRKALLWTALLSLLVVFLMIGSVIALFVTFTHAGGHVPPDGKPLPIATILPPGVIAVTGYINRLLVVVYCAWMILAASLAGGRGNATA